MRTMYCSVNEDIGVDSVSNSIPRNSFRVTKRNLHLVDNYVARITTDKMFKVRALGNLLMKKSLSGACCMKNYLCTNPWSSIWCSIRPSNLLGESQCDLGTRTGWRQVRRAIATNVMWKII